LQISSAGSGHVGGSLSVVELFVTLYENHMNVNRKNPAMNGRDRLIVSKGHSGPAVYAVLCWKGFFSREMLSTLNYFGTNLPSHCDMNKTPGIDMTTGSLGQGFSCAAGIAKAAKLCRGKERIYVVLGDGEIQEGQIWEAAMFCSHQKLDNLIAFVDYNNAQIDGKVSEICSIEPLAAKWKAFGWDVIEVSNGNSCEQIDAAILEAKKSKLPCAIILHTIKGKGVKFAEKLGVANHSMAVTKEMLDIAFAEENGGIRFGNA
jgi:transketolase